MATKLYLRDSQSAVAGYYDLLTAEGSVATTGVVNTAASGTNIQWTKTAGGSVMAWITPPFASGFTLTTTDINIWASESGTAANAGGRYELYRYQSGSEGAALGGGPFSDGVEFTKTTSTLMTWVGNNTDFAFNAGDRLVVKLFITNVGTMGGSLTCTLNYDGPTAATSGDTFINLNEAVSFATDNPAVALGNPADDATGQLINPVLNFTGTDPGGNTLEYNVQVDDASDFNPVAGGTVTYYFNASQAGPTDSAGVWANDTNAFDGSLSTYAEKTVTTVGLLNGTGTTAPTSGVSILSVRARMYGCASSVATLFFTVYSSGVNLNGTIGGIVTTPGWGSWGDLSTPSGGWTWAKVNALECQMSDNAQTGVKDAYRVEVEVTYDASVNPLLSKFSTTDAGFTAGHPFASGAAKAFTVQAADTLTAGVKYYWRVCAKDTLENSTYGAWSPGAHSGYSEFTTTAGGTNITVNVSAPESYASATLTPTATTTRSTSISATIQSFVSATLAPVISAVRNVSMDVAILAAAFTGLTPTVTANTGANISPPIESASYSQLDPTISTTRNVSITPAIQSGALATINPSLTLNDNEEISAGINSGTFATLSPTISAIRNVSSSVAISSGAFSTLDPTVSVTRNVSNSTAVDSGIFAQLVSSVSAIRNVSNAIVIQSGTFTILDPTITTASATNITVNADLQSATFATLTPTITTAKNISTSPAIESATFSQLASTVSITRNVSTSPTIQNATFTTIQPSITYNDNEQIAPGIQSAVFSTLDPTVTTTRSATTSPTIQSAVFATIQPVIQTGGNIEIATDIQNAVFNQPTATVSTTKGVSISPAIQEALFSTINPAITEGQGIVVSPSVESGVLSTINPIISAERNLSLSAGIQEGTFSTLDPEITIIPCQVDITVYPQPLYIGAIQKIFIVNRGKPAIYLGGNNYLEL